MDRNHSSLCHPACSLRALLYICIAFVSLSAVGQTSSVDRVLDQKLQKILHEAGFTGRVEASLETRLHRGLNPQLADLGRLLFF